MGWMLWYADGSTVSSEDCAPADVPGYGVEVIAQPDRTPGTGNVGYLVLAGYDWYYWRTDSKEWAGAAGDTSIWDLILHREPIVGICQGRRVQPELYQGFLDEAQAWADAAGLPRKSGFNPVERAR